MKRATALRVDEVRVLDHWCTSMRLMFPECIGVYQVGSSVTSETWRDVDIRIVLRDADYAELHGVLEVDDLNMLLSQWGQRATGLPIDAQVQALRMGQEHPRHQARPRGLRRSESHAPDGPT